MEKNTLVSFYFLSFLVKVSVACDQTIPMLGTNLAEYFSRRSSEDVEYFFIRASKGLGHFDFNTVCRVQVRRDS